MIAPGEVGTRHDGRGTYGHSMIVGPWGDILALNKNEPGVITADINLDNMKELRKQFPTIKHYQSFVMQDLVKEVNDE
jgi:nitrilase